jgi:hypothetical protein
MPIVFFTIRRPYQKTIFPAHSGLNGGGTERASDRGPPLRFRSSLCYGGAHSASGKRPSFMSEEEALRRKLDELKIEHRDLDDAIDRLANLFSTDQLQLQRLKKRKLVLKDLITKYESRLVPDIIA